jgi:hypothetical protein
VPGRVTGALEMQISEPPEQSEDSEIPLYSDLCLLGARLGLLPRSLGGSIKSEMAAPRSMRASVVQRVGLC